MNALALFFLFTGSGDDGFEYGDLKAIHPSETYDELKTRRVSNFNRLQTKISEGNVRLKNNRLEIYINSNEQIDESTINLSGGGSLNTSLVIYPFTPKYGVDYSIKSLFNADYGYSHTISGMTIKHPVRNIYFESYDVQLKYGGVGNAIYFGGSVRDSFFSELTIGKTIWYIWSSSTLGEVKTISSIDIGNKIIYLNSSISGSVSSNQAGNFGTEFSESISEADYLAYGGSWYINFATNTIIQGSPAATNGADYVLNLSDVSFSNSWQQITVSMGTAKFNLTNCNFSYGGVAFSFFVRGYAGGQKVTLNGTNRVSNNGFPIIGSISGLDTTLIYGAGFYLHDSVIVEQNGTLELVDNLASSWRQYSSGYNPANVGINYYERIIESGSGEYCILTSNVSPTTIDYIESESEIRLRHDTIINGGVVSGHLFSYNLDFGIGTITCAISDVVFSNKVELTLFDSAVLNNCDYTIQLYSSIPTLIAPSPTTTINGGTVYKDASVGTWTNGATTGSRGSNFIGLSSNITINTILFDGYFFMYFFDCGAPQQPYTEKDYSIALNDINIKCYQIWLDAPTNTAGTVSRIFTGTNAIVSNYLSSNHAGRSFPQNISGTSGTVSKSVTASKTLSIYGTVLNVLEIDHEHNYYETSGTINAIHATNTWASPYSGNTIYGRNIRLYAVGGDITLKTFDSSLRPTSNIIGTNDTVITNGNFLDVTIDNDRVLQSGTLQVTEEVILTGNGVTTSFRNVLANFILDNTVIANFKCGSIDINCDSSGNFTHTDVVGFLDYGTGKFQFIFVSPVSNGVQGKMTYNKPNSWLGTGAWVI